MSYGLRYQAHWASPKNNTGYLFIEERDYLGTTVDTLVLAANSMSIRYNFEDWNNPIMGVQAEFVIINTGEDFFTLIPLLSSEEGKYRIHIGVWTPTAFGLFEGFLNCDTITQKYLKRQPIRFAASNYLYKLDSFHPVSINTLKHISFIDIINEILRATGTQINVRVNCKLHAEGDILTPGQTLFNKNGFYTELFWKDNVEKESCLGVLKSILTTFDCYIYYWRGYWYIERYEDIWSTNKSYVEYASGTLYGPTGTGTVVNVTETVSQLKTIKFTGQSQTQHIIPGLKTIKVNLQDKRLFNIGLSDLTQVQPVGIGLPNPGFRKWLNWAETGISLVTADNGKPKGIISNSVKRIIPLPSSIPLTRGLYTGLKFTVDDPSTALNVKFKYVVSAPTIPNWTGVWKDYTFTFHWYVRTEPGLYFISRTEDVWKLIEGNELQFLQSVDVQGSSFDPANSCTEVSITIPLGEVMVIDSGLEAGNMKGDYNLVFGLGIETVKKEGVETVSPPAIAWIGDFNFSSTGGNQANVIEGTVNTNFLNKKEISVILYDCESFNYKNAILMGNDFQTRTEKWGTAEGSLNIIAKGVCWNTTGTPTIADNKTVDGVGSDAFTSVLTGLIPGSVYHVRSYFTDATGTTYYGDEKDFGTENLQLGDYHDGGLIAYFLQPGDPGYDAGVQHGIIVAPQDLPSDVWCRLAVSPRTCEAWFYAIGDGDDNTAKMMAVTNNMGLYAAKRCSDYSNGGYTDWVLGSLGDMRKVQSNKDIIKGFANMEYWTSSEVTGSGNMEFLTTYWKYAYIVHFNKPAGASGNYNLIQKNNSRLVRPIRYF